MNGWLGGRLGTVALVLALCRSGECLGQTSVVIHGDETRQTIDGFGANINHRSWDSNALPPVLNSLIDEGGLTLFRVVFDNTDWETNNDNDDPSVMNWDYYNAIYSSPRFEPLWNMIAWLNQRGFSNTIVLNFQGPGPDWMGQPLTQGYEEEWAEMIASGLIYARNTRHLQFGLVAPDNEPDLGYEGIQVNSAAQYVAMLHALALKLDENGLDDLKFVGPDLSVGAPAFMPEMLSDSVVMAKVAHFGAHSYSGGGSGSAGIYDLLQISAYSDRNFWMTEFGVWCSGCEDGSGNTNTWPYFRDTVGYLMSHLDNGASAGLIWEGYDSVYATLNFDWSYWGLFAVDDITANPKTYTPRKSLYTLAQLARFVRPGAQQLAITGSATLENLEAFYQPDVGQLTIVGINSDSNAAAITCQLDSLPAIASFRLYYTDVSTNIAAAGVVPVTNGVLSAIVPADCVFTLVGFDPAGPPIRLGVAADTNGVTLSWTNSIGGLVLESADSVDAGVWSPVTNTPDYTPTQWQVTVAPTNTAQFFRLRGP